MINIIRHLIIFALVIASNFTFADTNKVCPPPAENPTAELKQAAMRDASDHGFLWRISKGDHDSYLYGTIHVAKFEWMFPGRVVMQALNSSDTLALELDVLDPNIQQGLANGLSTFPKTKLPDVLIKRLRKQADLECIPYDSIAHLAPEFQIDALGLMEGAWERLYAQYAIDGILAGIGHSTHKTVVSLETPEFQFNVLKMKDSQETIEFVKDSLDELETGRGRTFLGRIAQIWGNSDYNAMDHFNEWCECVNTEIERNMMKRLLDERNPTLADKIDALHASGNKAFIAVGSLHLFGLIGLPALLEKRGYHIERVELNLK